MIQFDNISHITIVYFINSGIYRVASIGNCQYNLAKDARAPIFIAGSILILSKVSAIIDPPIDKSPFVPF